MYIGVEIGGTKQQVCIGTEKGEILKRYQVKLGQMTTAQNILQWIQETIRQIQTQWTIEGIGVGFGGPLDKNDERVICSCHIPGWDGFPIANWFRKTFSLPVTVRNDTVTGGLGELYLGAGQGSNRLFYTNIGTGIGGGSYWPGGYCASTLGYVWVPNWDNHLPGTATRLEFLCSGPSIEKRLNTLGYIPDDSILAKEPRPLTCRQLGENAQKGDIFCCQELDRVAQTFAYGLTDILALCGVDRIVIGGGVAKMGDVLFSRIRKFTTESAFVGNIDSIDIQPGTLQDDAVLVGALLLAADPNIHSHHSVQG